MRKRTVHIDPYVFQEQNRLGSGAFSIVYRGSYFPGKGDPNAFFAIKEIAIATDEKVRTFVEKEVEIMNKLNHPCIVRITDVITSKDYVYIVMEFCNMGNLREFVLRNELSEEEILHLFRQIVSAFRHIRGLNLIHRDIKPDNILLHNFITKIADFGFAKILTEINEQASTYAGTPMYMSPQVLRGEFYTSQADLWSLGVVFYFCYAKKEPWLQAGEKVLKNSIMVLQRIEQIISSQSLPFPPTTVISEASKGIISSMLKEKGQMTWDQLFDHEMLMPLEEIELQKNQSNSPDTQTLFKNISKVVVVGEDESIQVALVAQDNLFKKNFSETGDAIFVSKRIQHERDSFLFLFNTSLLLKQMGGRLKVLTERPDILTELGFLIFKRIRNWCQALLMALEKGVNFLELEESIWNNFKNCKSPNEYERLIILIQREFESHEKNYQRAKKDLQEKSLRADIREFVNQESESFEELKFTESMMIRLISELKGIVKNEKNLDLLILLDNLLISLTIKGTLLWNPKKPFNIKKFYEDRRNSSIEFLRQRVLDGIRFIEQ